MEESDGSDRADQKQSTYAKGDLRELEQAAGKDECATTDGQTATPLVAQIIRRIREATQAREAAEEAAERKIQAAQLRITNEDVVHWAEIGERCKRIEFYFTELAREEDELNKLIAPTPLRYDHRAVRDILADSVGETSGEPEDGQTRPVPLAEDRRESEEADHATASDAQHADVARD